MSRKFASQIDAVIGNNNKKQKNISKIIKTNTKLKFRNFCVRSIDTDHFFINGNFKLFLIKKE